MDIILGEKVTQNEKQKRNNVGFYIPKIWRKQKYYIEIAKIPLFNLVIVPTLLECSQKGRKFSMLCVLIYASKIEFRAKNH